MTRGRLCLREISSVRRITSSVRAEFLRLCQKWWCCSKTFKIVPEITRTGCVCVRFLAWGEFPYHCYKIFKVVPEIARNKLFNLHARHIKIRRSTLTYLISCICRIVQLVHEKHIKTQRTPLTYLISCISCGAQLIREVHQNQQKYSNISNQLHLSRRSIYTWAHHNYIPSSKLQSSNHSTCTRSTSKPNALL